MSVATRSSLRASASASTTTTAPASPPPTPARKRKTQAPRASQPPSQLEFGGPWGTAFIIALTHVMLYYFWVCLDSNKGSLVGPYPTESASAFVKRLCIYIGTHAAPTTEAVTWYAIFITSQALFSAFLPGIAVRGLTLPDGSHKMYNCNGLWAWYLTLALTALLHVTGVMPLTAAIRMTGPLLTVAVIAGNAFSLLTYVAAYAYKKTNRVTGNFVYDFFMGASLNPRLFGDRLDLKMWAETRVSWTLLFLITASAAAEQYETLGTVTPPMAFMLLAHFLYGNACAKGEEMIPTTWDIFHENWGWMLCFWNLAGVPLVYSWQSVFILRANPVHHPLHVAACFALLLASYYVWDTANSQKNRFRMQRNGNAVQRNAFPQLPWGTVADPEVIETKAGTALLVDGWWRYARKPHYTADLGMAFAWGAVCGFSALLPWCYFVFFVAVLTHRAVRDIERCAAKYGADWERYCKRVPYTFVPGLF